MFECKLKHAWRECGCIPWNYPHFVDPNTGNLTNVCDYVGNHCFEARYKDFLKKIPHCGCYPDCEGYSYTYSVSSQRLTPSDHCDVQRPGRLTKLFILSVFSEEQISRKSARPKNCETSGV